MTGGAFSLLASVHISRYLKKYHTGNFTVYLAAFEMVTLGVFGYTHSPYLLVPLFLAHFVLQSLLYTCINVFIESFSKFAQTGSIRGMFLTLFNLGVLLSPAIGGFMLRFFSFSTLYLTAALTLIPFIYLTNHFLTHIKEPAYTSVDLLGALKKALKNKNLKGVLLSALLMECFYAVMVIYSPMYLQGLGINLETYMTSILPFALIPLVVLPYELGYLADTKFGEKEMLVGGLLILAFTSFACVIIRTDNTLVWTALFVFSRIGAAFVETMAFTYYFKKINKEDASLTALFSNTRPMASILVGGIGALVAPIMVVRPEIMFIILGCGILWCISYVLPIEDTL
jgi:hypothetical protein